MLVKELKEMLSSFPEYMEVVINSEGGLYDISRNSNRVNVDEYSKLISEEFVDDAFDEKEAVLMLSIF